MKHTFLFFSFIICSMIIVSCGNNQPKVEPIKIPQNEINKKLLESNQNFLKTEKADIEAYIERHHWEMQATGTGIKYFVYFKGKGTKAEIGKLVTLKYESSFLNGNKCYSSENLGNKIFTLGKAQIERGLEEAILLMQKGDKARVIIPSHQAYGLVGDGNRIPPRATLIYDIEIIDIK